MLRIFLLLLLVLLSGRVQAGVLDVFPDGSGLYPDIEQAIFAAQSGDSIRLADGIFTGTGNRNLFLGEDITVYSASGNPAECILDLEEQGRGFFIQTMPGSHISISGLTVRGGNPADVPDEFWTGYGGALMVEGIAPGGGILIEHCIFEANRAEAGGAAFLWQCAVEFVDCVVRHNTATDGSGIYCGFCNFGEGISVRECVFNGNDYPYPDVGGYGAGMYFSHSHGTVENCTFTANRAWLGAGLLVSTDSDVLVQSSILAFASQGQGLVVNAGQLEISSCDIFGNADGDWVGVIADQLGIACNVCLDPLFCEPGMDDFTLRDDSPCLPENNGDCGLIGARTLGCSVTTAADQEDGHPANGPSLGLCTPNPGNPITTISFTIAAGTSNASLEVVDMTGHRVALLAEGIFTTGHHEIVWRGVGDDGVPVSSGVYFFRLNSNGHTRSQKFLLLK